MATTAEVGKQADRRRFVAFVPLSSWLRGYDRYRRRWSKTLLTKSRFPDAFYMHRADEDLSVGMAKARSLVARLGLPGDAVVALVADLPITVEAPNAR